LLQKLDLNNDGVITVDEFINYCSMVSKATRSEVLSSAVKTVTEMWGL
jgi:Ca2+-binding EF-hand superfamily protein